MNREKALDKIKKCLRLAASSNEHEAAAALRQAQKLMEEYKISSSDVNLADVGSHSTKDHAGNNQRYEAYLASMVSEVFGTNHFVQIKRQLVNSHSRLGFRRLHAYVFVGKGASAELASYCFDVLLRQLVKARTAHMARQPKNCKPATRTARGDEFAWGYVSSLRSKCQALAVTDDDRKLIEQWIEVNVGELESAKLKDRTTGQNVSTGDWHAGRIEGDKANLHAGVNGRAQELLS